MLARFYAAPKGIIFCVMTLPEQPRAIFDRQALIAALAALRVRALAEADHAAAALALYRAALYQGRAEVQRRFLASQNGALAHAGNAFVIDQIIRTLYEEALRAAFAEGGRQDRPRLCVAAVGGYGRAALAPFSDIDLLFLQDGEGADSALSRRIMEAVLYPLWDLGLKVGHSVQTVASAITAARQDLTLCTAFLEARRVAGDAALFTAFADAFEHQVRSAGDMNFTTEKLAERDARHLKTGDARYVLEPNLKEGKGGLRDLQTLSWIGGFLYRAPTARDLAARGVLTAREADLFERAAQFFMTLRCHLHYLAGRAEDRITFGVQPELAARMGYAARSGVLPVERFMKHYFLTARNVGDLTRIFCAALDGSGLRAPAAAIPASRAGALEGFPLEAGRLGLPSPEALSDHPEDMLLLFRLAQKHGVGIHPRALRAVTRSLGILTSRAIRDDHIMTRLFMDILTARENPEHVLRQMNECGLLGRLLPEFGRIVGQMQYNMYHVYTTDEHTIRAIGLLNRIEQGELADDHPLASRVVSLVASREVLYAAVLMHDIAKGRGGDHSVLGAEVARDLCPRLGLDAAQTETVAWLVRHHLAMSDTAFKRDLDDPAAINAFVSVVQSPERLRLLLCLTVVDIRAVGPNVWNNWKATLLRQLYARAEQVMSGDASPENRAERIAAAKMAMAALLSRWPAAELDAHLARFHPLYFLAHDAAELARHGLLVRRADRNRRYPAVDIATQAESGVTIVTVYAPDMPGLVSKIAGALALSGLSVLAAKIHTSTDGMALDSFIVQNTLGGPCEQRQQTRLRGLVRKVLADELDPALELEQRARSALAARQPAVTVSPQVFIDNRLSETHTVVEVNGLDRSGLLFALTRALSRQDLRIDRARISTFGERAVDVFYVRDGDGGKIEQPARLEEVRRALRAALATTPEGTFPAVG